MTNPLKYFFWACSGSTISLLRRKDCDTEHSKYVAIGAAVFLTGVLAGVSASYAFFTILDSVGWAIAFGAFWGVMIFNLDRYLVLSIRKKAPHEVVTRQDLLRNWGSLAAIALPRVVLAALLALVIAKPLELLIFEDEIKLEMQSLRVDQAKEFQQQLGAEQGGEVGVSLTQRIERLKQENVELERQISEKEKEREAARQAAVDEALGLAQLPPGEGKMFEIKRDIATAKQAETEEFIKPKRELLNLNNERIKGLVARQTQLEQQAAQVSESTDGLATRLQAFSRLTEKNAVVGYANLLIVAIILILETAPILTKLYADYGPYDKLVEVAERRVYLAQQQEMEDVETQMREHRESYGRRNDALTGIQKWVVQDTIDETHNAKHGSETQVKLRRAKNDLIEQATYGLTHTHRNGEKNGDEH